MYARVVLLTGVRDIDAAVAYLQQEPLTVVRSQRGYQGLSVGADRSSGLMALLSLWETAADRDASESALAKTRQDAQRELGATMTVETLDQLAVLVSKPPEVGRPLAFTRISMDPARVAENVEFFKQEILPQIAARPGFRSARQLLNPSTGEGIVSMVWDDEQSRAASLEYAQTRRPEAIARGVTFGERTLGEIVFADVK